MLTLYTRIQNLQKKNSKSVTLTHLLEYLRENAMSCLRYLILHYDFLHIMRALIMYVCRGCWWLNTVSLNTIGRQNIFCLAIREKKNPVNKNILRGSEGSPRLLYISIRRLRSGRESTQMQMWKEKRFNKHHDNPIFGYFSLNYTEIVNVILIHNFKLNAIKWIRNARKCAHCAWLMCVFNSIIPSLCI